jgi:histidinol-phosphate phosphatase family protein
MKIVLLDRDGTVIVDPPDLRVDSVDEIVLFPDTIEALKLLANNGFKAIFVTNQAGIAEGRFNLEEYETIQGKVLEILKPSGLEFLKTYMAPQSQDEFSEWRKPGPGMLLQAAKDFDFDLAETYMVGDRLSDIQAGQNAGSKTILVKTANTNVEAPTATYTARTLLDAAQFIVTAQVGSQISMLTHDEEAGDEGLSFGV